MKQKDKWCGDYTESKYIYPHIETNREDWLKGFEFCKEELRTSGYLKKEDSFECILAKIFSFGENIL